MSAVPLFVHMCELVCTWMSATSCRAGFFSPHLSGATRGGPEESAANMAAGGEAHTSQWCSALKLVFGVWGVFLFEASESTERSFSCGVAQPPRSALLNPARRQLKREVKERELGGPAERVGLCLQPTWDRGGGGVHEGRPRVAQSGPRLGATSEQRQQISHLGVAPARLGWGRGHGHAGALLRVSPGLKS